MFYAVIFFTFLISIFLFFGIKKPKNFPPGPKWYPIFGSALQISQLRLKHGMLCKAIKELNNFHDANGVVGLKIGQDKVVIVYTCEAIKEMMTNEELDGRPDGIFYKSRTFNSRKGILVVDEDFWLEQRRFIVRHLKDFGFSRRNMAEMIQNEAQHLLEDLNSMVKQQNLNKDVNGNTAILSFQEFFPVYVLNTLWTMIAGVRYDRNHKEIMELLKMFYELFKTIDMIGTLFSHFPFLRYIAPDFSGYSNFVENHRRVYTFFRKEVENHRKTFSLNDEPRDLIDKYLQVLALPDHKSSFSEEQLLAVCLDMFLAGSETTNKSLGFAFLHMVRDPTIQKKAQDEIDSVIGRERLPTWDDRVNLPYCDAIVHEAIRFFMGYTFGVPHRALVNTRLSGYNIPKNTMVIACFHGMLMDEDNFPNPTKFWPDRFIKNNKLVIPDTFAPFGLGRHRCMGEVMGKQNLFLFITTLLQNYNFLPLEGKPLPDDEPVDGATASVKSYIAMAIKR
ncbi:probable cytochrome P450 303a1 [Condylostylus longicornis]|uniref:probable cytochrome P450 303a1 n=1 Tax=Condylostylus longicornis TaxID=2530218 RepID=UPI00244DCCF8|nr:probable cytochrome P450 303a1 [Condylostylus longicornis]